MSYICPYSKAIKERRLALGLTQEQVCEGICSTGALSRIESGKINPSLNRARALMERLDLSEGQYFAMVGQRELDMEELREAVVEEGSRFFRETGVQRRQAQERALAKLRELEALREEDDHIAAQFIAARRVLLTEPEGDDAWLARGEALTEILRRTQPRFRLEDLAELRLCVFELELAAHIAFALAVGGKGDPAASKRLDEYCAAHFQEERQWLLKSIDVLPLVAVVEPLRQGRWAEALSLAEAYRRVPWCSLGAALLTEIMARCRLELGEADAARDLYRQAYYLHLAMMSEGRAQTVAGEAEARLGFPLLSAEERMEA